MTSGGSTLPSLIYEKSGAAPASPLPPSVFFSSLASSPFFSGKILARFNNIVRSLVPLERGKASGKTNERHKKGRIAEGRKEADMGCLPAGGAPY